MPNQRIQSIDTFRGLTILTMILVNDLAGVRAIPAWLKHAAEGSDSVTFVDVVFPAFLFIVGMAIPIALEKRLGPRKEDHGLHGLARNRVKEVKALGHVGVRTAGLLILGVLMVNIHSLNEAATRMSKNTWMVLMFVSAILVWNRYPSTKGAKRLLARALRIVGVAGLITLTAIYRSGEAENIGWLTTQWWGILGLIGWAYLASSIVYIIFRRNIAALGGVLALFVALYIVDKSGALGFLAPVTNYLWLGGHVGGHASITTAGIIAALLVMDDSPAPTVRKRITWLLVFAAFLLFGGYFLRPLYGISKNMATPAWCLYSAAICVALYALLYWIVDVKHFNPWTKIVEPAGTNALLAYILPDIVYGLVGILGVTWYAEIGYGALGIVRSGLFALAMVWATGWLTRLGIRLRL